MSDDYLERIGQRAHATAISKGFYSPPPTFAERIALVHSELSEALEAYRERGLENWSGKNDKPEGVASELADTVIRICDLCAFLGIDLRAAIEQKMAFNETRPFRHGEKSL